MKTEEAEKSSSTDSLPRWVQWPGLTQTHVRSWNSSHSSTGGRGPSTRTTSLLAMCSSRDRYGHRESSTQTHALQHNADVAGRGLSYCTYHNAHTPFPGIFFFWKTDLFIWKAVLQKKRRNNRERASPFPGSLPIWLQQPRAGWSQEEVSSRFSMQVAEPQAFKPSFSLFPGTSAGS